MKSFPDCYILPDHLLPQDVDSVAADFTSRFTQSAKSCFGTPSETFPRPKKFIPWWNTDCRDAVRARRRATKDFSSHPAEHKFLRYKRLTATAR